MRLKADGATSSALPAHCFPLHNFSPSFARLRYFLTFSRLKGSSSSCQFAFCWLCLICGLLQGSLCCLPVWAVSWLVELFPPEGLSYSFFLSLSIHAWLACKCNQKAKVLFRRGGDVDVFFPFLTFLMHSTPPAVPRSAAFGPQLARGHVRLESAQTRERTILPGEGAFGSCFRCSLPGLRAGALSWPVSAISSL